MIKIKTDSDSDADVADATSTASRMMSKKGFLFIDTIHWFIGVSVAILYQIIVILTTWYFPFLGKQRFGYLHQIFCGFSLAYFLLSTNLYQ